MTEENLFDNLLTIDGMGKGFRFGEPKQLLKHFHNVVVSVVFVVEQDDVVELFELWIG